MSRMQNDTSVFEAPIDRVAVVKVEIGWSELSDYVGLSCGHAILLDTEEDNASLVGAETVCKRCNELTLRTKETELLIASDLGTDDLPPCSHSWVMSNPLSEYSSSWCEWCGERRGGNY